MPYHGTKHWFIDVFIRAKRTANKSPLHIISESQIDRESTVIREVAEWIRQIHFVSKSKITNNETAEIKPRSDPYSTGCIPSARYSKIIFPSR